MKTDRLQPRDDETIVSFASRAFGESFDSIDSFQRDFFGVTVTDARRAERQAFDWDWLSIKLGPSAAQLRAMSERALLTVDDGDWRASRTWSAEMPWIKLGYPAYSPEALRRSQHIRLRWLRPDALVNEGTATLFLRHCPQCGAELAKMKFRFAFPDCPACHEPLSNAKSVIAPSSIVKFSRWFSALVDQAYANRPIDPRSPDMIRVAAIWNVARLLDERGSFERLAADCADRCGVGSIPLITEGSDDIAVRALRHASMLAAASFLAGKIAEITNSVAFVYHSNIRLDGVQVCVERVMRRYAEANGLWVNEDDGDYEEPELALSWTA